MNEEESEIQKAKATIGENEKDDYVINLSEHAKLYEEKAPGLAKLLTSSAAKIAANEYERLDKEALEAQSKFSRFSRCAYNAVFWAAVATAGLTVTGVLHAFLNPGGLLGMPTEKIAIAIFGAAGIISATIGTIYFNQIRNGKLLEKWMNKRAETETQRLYYFDLATRPPEPPMNQAAQPLLQFEYFRRYQFDVQLSYYGVRSRQHAALAEKSINFSTWMLGIAGLINALASFFGWTHAYLTTIAAAAIVFQALAVKSVNREAINQYGRNAERYDRTRAILNKLAGDLDKVRMAIVRGNMEIFQKFVSAVHEQISLEHRQWLSARDERVSIIGQFEKQLKDLEEKIKP